MRKNAIRRAGVALVAALVAAGVMARATDGNGAGQAAGGHAGEVITLNVYYTGKNGSARKFVREVERMGTADSVRREAGNLRYDYFVSAGDPEVVLLVEKWKGREAVEAHNATPMMGTIGRAKKKYGLATVVERFVSGGDPQ